jgi:uncharacterized protein YoxC
MSTLLQICLILASLSIVAFVAVMLPLMFFAKKKIEHFATANDQVRTNLNELIRECRELIGQITKLTERADAELNEVSQVVHTVQDWADRATGVVKEVTGFVEPIMQNVNRFRSILSAVSQMFGPKKLPQSS